MQFLQKLTSPFKWFLKLSFTKKLKVVFVSFLSVIITGILTILAMYLAVSNGIFGVVPTKSDLTDLNNAQASEVYAEDGVLLGRYYVENRTDAKYEEVNPFLINALIATEDARFYEHEGVDQISLLRVLVKSVILQQNKGGGSTLSQQLAKNIYGRKKYGVLTMPVNKMREAIIANRMEEVYTKKEILMLYLNTVSFGEDTYGINTACERFFSKTALTINKEEAAVLIGMLKSPSYYNPRTKPENAKQRRNVVLHQAYANQFITENEKDSLQNLPLIVNYKRLSHNEGRATHFREHLRQYLEKWLLDNPKADGTTYNLYTDGLTITTTLNSKLQTYAEEAVVERIAELQPILDKDLKQNKVFIKQAKRITSIIKKTDGFKQFLNNGLTEKQALAEYNKPHNMVLNTLKGEVDTVLSSKDSVQYYLSALNAGFLAVNPINGKILAWVGGASFTQNQYDHVLSKRQVGSIFKPIVYAQALISGKQPCDYVSNQKVTYTEYDNWQPENADNKDDGKYSIAGALTNSVNTISVKLCMDAGIKNVIGLATKLGIDEKFPEVPSIALGTVETSLYKMIGAYTSFANKGVYSQPQFINNIKNNNDEIIYEFKHNQINVFSEFEAQNMVNMMRKVIDEGTSTRLRTKYGVKGDVAGKTGTTQNQQDGWFMGITPSWLGGAWVGANYPFIHFSSIRNGQGANTALPIWAKFYNKIEKDKELQNYVNQYFGFRNEIDCENFKEDNFFNKLFKNKNKKDTRDGKLTKKDKRKEKRKKRKKKKS
ncbi:MAG: transglycosylase domain-containing protein [Flavobacteriales bacterium]|nr:transglycosylase domain-containing protein [Flavobacteriales bacterium]MCB9365224.1 transglycosylase domain-containing protein [Flavobacteriales bacterium]